MSRFGGTPESVTSKFGGVPVVQGPPPPDTEDFMGNPVTIAPNIDPEISATRDRRLGMLKTRPAPVVDPAVKPVGGPLDPVQSKFGGQVEKANPVYPYKPDVIAAQYPELMPKVNPDRGIFGEIGAALVNTLGHTSKANELLTSMISGRGVRKSLDEYRSAPLGMESPEPSDSLTGKAIGLTVGLAPAIVGGPAQFGVSSFANVLDRTDGNVGAAAGAGAVAVGLGFIPVTELVGKNPYITALVNRVGEKKATKFLAEQAIEALAVGGSGAAFAGSDELFARAGGATPQDFNLGEHALSMLAAHYGLKAPGYVTAPMRKVAAESARQAYVKEGLVTPTESTILGEDQPAKYAQIASARAAGHEVVVSPKGEITTTPDVVPFEIKRRLNNDPVAIQFVREQINAGKKPFFIDETRLAPTPEEVVSSKTQLEKLRDEITPTIKPTEYTELGAPVTERALYLQDINNQIERMGKDQSRQQVTNARALDGASGRLKGSETVIDEVQSTRALKDKNILSLTADDYKPVVQLKYPMRESEAKGYFKPAEDLSKDPRTQATLAKIKRRTLEAYQIISDELKVDGVTKILMTQALDAEHAARTEKALGKDPTLNTAKSTAKTRVARAKTGPKVKTDALAQLDRAFESIARRTDNETARGMVDRLSDELKSAPQPVRELVLDNEPWNQVIGRHQGAQDWVEVEQRVRRQLVDASLSRERSMIVEGLKILKDESRATFVKALGQARTPEKVKALAKQIDLARAVEQRRQDYSLLKRVSEKAEKSAQREQIHKLISNTLSPAKKAEGKKAPEKAVRPVLRFEGKDYLAEPGETNHMAMMDRVADLVPEASRDKFWKSLDDSAKLFETNHGRVIDGPEAQRLNKSMSPVSDSILAGVTFEAPTKKSTVDSSKPKAGKPVIELDPSTGRSSLNWTRAEKALDSMSNDAVTDLANRTRQLDRQAAIERGVYKKYMGFSTNEDAVGLQSAIAKAAPKERTQVSHPWLHFAKNVVYPVTNEGWLAALSRFDYSNPLYKTFVGNFIEGQRRHYQNMADSRRYLGEAAKTLGFDYSTIKGKAAMERYLLQPLTNGVTRGEAMNAWLVSRDPGRQDAADVGVKKQGTIYKLEQMTADLSPKDIAFAESLRSYFHANSFIEKALYNFRLLNGYDVERTLDHWVSSREPMDKGPKTDFNTFTPAVERVIDPLRDRQTGVNTPYEARDVVAEFLRAGDSLSRYAENGIDLYRAASAINDPRVREALTKHLGEDNINRLELHLSNVAGTVGVQNKGINKVFNEVINNYAVSKIALNVFSASKQSLDVLTFMAEGTLSKRSIIQAVAERAWMDKRVTKNMTDNDGMAFLRYNGHLLENLATMSDTNQSHSGLAGIRERSLVLQKTIDRAMLSIAWRASELEAQRQGYKGVELREQTSRLFDQTISRAQPTNNPLFEGELEIESKRNPLLRGTLTFMRAPNRIFNVVNRRVTEAVQNPTETNVHKAGQAIMFGIIGNTLGIVGINALRRVAFNKDQDEKTFAMDGIDSVTGMFYLGAPAGVIVEGLFNPKVKSDRLGKSPLTGLVVDGAESVWNLRNALMSSGEMASGPSKGESRSSVALTKAADSAFSLVSGVSGMPLWALWYQARGLYNWTKPQAELTVRFEQERRQLKSDGRQTSLRYQELTEAQNRIEKLHRSRQAGLATALETQRAVEEELRRVVR